MLEWAHFSSPDFRKSKRMSEGKKNTEHSLEYWRYIVVEDKRGKTHRDPEVIVVP